MRKTPEEKQKFAEIIAEGEKLQARNMIRGFRPGVPFGWSAAQWQELLQSMSDSAKKSGLSDEEIIAAGLPKPS